MSGRVYHKCADCNAQIPLWDNYCVICKAQGKGEEE